MSTMSPKADERTGIKPMQGPLDTKSRDEPVGRVAAASGVDLTFATLQATDSQYECKIQNSTRNIYLLMVLLILTFAKVPTKPGCEC